LYTAYKILEGTTRSFEIVDQERGQLWSDSNKPQLWVLGRI
jgi:hypothetical protein